MATSSQTLTLSGDKLEHLRTLSGWINSLADSPETKGKLVLHRNEFPGDSVKWQFLRDLFKDGNMGYIEDDKLIVDGSKGYTPRNLKKAADYFLIGKAGEEIKTLQSNGYIKAAHKQRTLSHGHRKPRAPPKSHDYIADLEYEERGYRGGRQQRRYTRKNRK